MEYIYKCNNCEIEFNIYRPIGSTPNHLYVCPKCGSDNTRRKWTNISIHYKDDGFTKQVKEDA